MPDITMMTASQTAILTAMDAGILALAEVALYTSDTPILSTSITADFVEAGYAGYARKALVSVVPSISDAGEPELVYNVGIFRPTGTATPDPVVYGGLLVTAADALIGAWRFDTPFPQMVSTADVIAVTLRIRVDPLGGIAVIVT